MSARPESPMMRALRQHDLAAHELRFVDVLAAIGFVVVLIAVICVAITLDDLGRGLDPSVIAAIAAFLDALDGGVR